MGISSSTAHHHPLTRTIDLRVFALMSLAGLVCGCTSSASDNMTGQTAPTVGQCVVSGGTNSGAVTQNCQTAPKLKSPYLAILQEKWADGAEVLRALQGATTDEQIDAAIPKANNWAKETVTWIAQHMTRAAAEKFVQIRGHALSWNLDGDHKAGEVAKRSNAINVVGDWLDNLDALMRSDEMYPQ